MRVPHVAIGAHGERSFVLVAQPLRHRGDIHPALDATGGEKVAQVMDAQQVFAIHLRLRRDVELSRITLPCTLARR